MTQKIPYFSICANLYYINFFNFFSILLKYYYFLFPYNFIHSHQLFFFFFFPKISQFSSQKQTSTSSIDNPLTHDNPQILAHGTAPLALKNQPINHSSTAFSLTATKIQPNTHSSCGNNTTTTTTTTTQSKPKIKAIQNPRFLHSNRSASKPMSLL